MNKLFAALNIYKDYETGGNNYGIYNYFSNQFLKTEKGIYSITMNIATFAAGISLLLAVAYLAVFANGKAKEHEEAKKWVLRVLIISVLVFSVTGLVTLIGNAGMKV